MTTSTLQCGCRSYLSKKQVIRREDSYSTAGLFVFTGVMRRMRQCGTGTPRSRRSAPSRPPRRPERTPGLALLVRGARRGCGEAGEAAHAGNA